MSLLLTAHSISKAHGSLVLFQDISLQISEGDRIGFIGPNGAGKTSLIQILADVEQPDSGYITKRQNTHIGYASQSPQFPAMPLEDLLICEVPKLHEVEARTRARILLGKAEFPDSQADASTLSGGWKKRLDIIRALMIEPNILLLDEPTNHLDLEGIVWLEAFLEKLAIPYLVISHDRYFLENISNKIMELNRCYPEGILMIEGNMSTFIAEKEEFLNAQENKRRELAFKVREEVSWLRTSPKARTTKSRSRIQQAYRLIDELADVKDRSKVTKVGIDFTASERQTRNLLVVKNLEKSLGGKQLFKHVDLTLSPGVRLGVVGRNGTGKTTFLKTLAGVVPQDVGTIKFADDLKLVYFDQHREQIPLHYTLKEAISPNSDIVNYRGQQIHINGWIKRFLFTPDRINLPISYLSGGERARLLIAKLMLQPADVLFLDEPTNDLDIPTLEVIEESLMSFNGAVVLISHDRCMMERICTKVIGLGEANDHHFYASYSQWEEAQSQSKVKEKPKSAEVPASAMPIKEKAIKLSYKEKKELESMEELIHAKEQEIEKLQDSLESPEDYQKLADAQKALEILFERWEHLDEKSRKE